MSMPVGGLVAFPPDMCGVSVEKKLHGLWEGPKIALGDQGSCLGPGPGLIKGRDPSQLGIPKSSELVPGENRSWAELFPKAWRAVQKGAPFCEI